MPTLIALLRGINIGGNNKLPMKELTALLEGMGLRDVQTYIQSGNVVFRCDVKNRAALAAKIGAAIADNPYPEAEADPKSLSLLFLAEVPQHPDLKAMEAIKTDSERYKLVGKVLYLHAPEGFGRSRLATRAEKLLGVAASGRNWNTVCKLAEMVA